MPKFIMMMPSGKTVDMTNDIKQSKTETDVRKVLTKTLKKGMPPKTKARGE